MKKTQLLFIILFIHSLAWGQNQSKDYLKLGGAFRYTYMYNSWNAQHKSKGGQLIFDALILNTKGQYKGIGFEIETRYYAESFGGLMLRNSFVNLPLTKGLNLKLGMPRTPFGILPFTGNSFMFNMPYYLGFSDDSDLGLTMDYTQEKWEFQLAYAKNSEDIFSQKNRRYAYDISGDNEELNQFTLRSAYHFGKNNQNEIGISGQYGQLFNTPTTHKGNKYALALHTVLQKNHWDLKAQAMWYAFNPKDATPVNYITMGAFASDYQVAKSGFVYTLSTSYTWLINHRLLKDIKFYNDFSALQKTTLHNGHSYMNVLGMMLHKGPIYLLIDYVVAQNHPWIGTNYNQALSVGGDARWHKRFNINLGVYF